MIYSFRTVAASVLATFLFVSGCGSSDGLTAVSGTVTYDGQPVAKGTVNFTPADGNGPTAAAVIVDGKYSTKIMPGKKKVRIESFKVVGQRRLHPNDTTSPPIDIQEQTLPARYNTKSELTREIASGMRTCDFALEK